MNRRSFAKSLAFSLPLLAAARSIPRKKRILPRRLQPGDTIGMITPGSYISDESLEKAVNNALKLGFKVKMGKHIRAQNGFNAGTDQQRLDDLHLMFSDDSVAGIWCARGGYGCSRLLPAIDYKLIAKKPKALIGYSDITALLNAIYQKTGLVGFHGPVGASELTEYTEAQFRAVVMEGQAPYAIPLSTANQEKEEEAYRTYAIRPGKAKGRLVGGNLSLLAALAGTEYLPEARGKLVFIEDVGEKPYRIDRMLTQLRQAWGLSGAAGIAMGVYADCQPKEGELSLSLEETIRDRTGSLGIPAIYGLSFGHIDNQCTLPVGIEAELDVEMESLVLLEAAVR
ncbi:MAG: LD-carboxypeptidase [Lewinellaceae bacterium]|nr:LD-carboxypeptidase [Phaeodactylibacter sp.]MCB0611809.1 LD-carboxypeptidase [Phaeodactylibacter sp.]MCB9347044.1 LD-carboxypeptidase [Lewinellaceae bacterium]